MAPYVTTWTGEAKVSVSLVVTASGVAYADPVRELRQTTLVALCL